MGMSLGVSIFSVSIMLGSLRDSGGGLSDVGRCRDVSGAVCGCVCFIVRGFIILCVYLFWSCGCAASAGAGGTPLVMAVL